MVGLMARMWMVRSDGGRLYEDFRDRSVVALGWTALAPYALPGVSREELAARYQSAEPGTKRGTIVSGSSQVWRFVNEMQVDDVVLTYSPTNRTYLLGRVAGSVRHEPAWAEEGMAICREVRWDEQEVSRSALSLSTRNSLGSTLTFFEVPESAGIEILRLHEGKTLPTPDADSEEEQPDPLDELELLAIERTKDLVSELGWDDMQLLVAGILRAMGYKTQVSPQGSDRGKDIVASPDGFGFENPRIVVEVKHRAEAMSSSDVRSFLGGRHKDDRGLYVSTGGFTRDAYYEADRATIPVALWTLDHVVRALMEHYEATDAETKRLVPLKRIYWPA